MSKRTDQELAERKRRRQEDEAPSLEELAADAGEARSTLDAAGLECPHCGCKHFEVVYTEQIYRAIRRRRACRHCGWRCSTVEKIPAEQLATAAGPNASAAPAESRPAPQSRGQEYEKPLPVEVKTRRRKKSLDS